MDQVAHTIFDRPTSYAACFDMLITMYSCSNIFVLLAGVRFWYIIRLAGSHLIPNHYADYRIDGLRITLPLPRRPLKTRAGLTSKSEILNSKSADSGLHAVSAIPFAFAKSPLEVPEGRINVEIGSFEVQKRRFRPRCGLGDSLCF